MRSNLTGEDALLDVAAASCGVSRRPSVSWVYARVESPECDMPSLPRGPLSQVSSESELELRTSNAIAAGRGRHDFARCDSV